MKRVNIFGNINKIGVKFKLSLSNSSDTFTQRLSQKSPLLITENY